MKEVEFKILEIDRIKIEKALFVLNAQKIFDAELLTLFFDFKDGSIRKRQDVLRLRKDSKKTELTFKHVHFEQTAKIADEYTVEVSDLDPMVKILQQLGLSVTQKMQKHRVSYALEGVRFDIDRYSGEFGFVPEFLEIEGEVDQIHKYAALLGFQEKDCLPWSTDDLLRYYAEKKVKQS